MSRRLIARKKAAHDDLKAAALANKYGGIMSSLLERFNITTNFEGLIQLLAKNLYPEPDVFVRELIQNAHDSIILRRELEPELDGRIDVEYDINARTITFRDNGIGMDQEDIKEFLAVIGSTGTGTARQQLQEQGKEAAYKLIGQFGIGMLSAFVVADKVVVRTRKLGAQEAFAWHNAGSASCELYADDKKQAGTEVVVIVGTSYTFMLDEKRLRDAIIKYCDFIPYRINLNGQGPVNVIEGPWHREYWSSEAEKEASYKLLLNRRYPDDVPLDVIPIEINEPFKARGALYISDRHVADINTTGVIDIFVRRMFIRANDNTFLPPWAKFVRGIIDSPDLPPTAARDNILRNHPSFEFMQKRLGELIVERLAYLSQKEPNKFKQINLWHHYHLKGMAYYYDDFFDQVAAMLLFETNKGLMSLQDYLTKNAPRPETENKAPIYYFAYHGAATQFYRLAGARGWVVINAGRRFDEELLEQYAKRYHRTVHLERLDATDDPELFQRLDRTDEERFRQLELDMEGHLHRLGLINVSVRMRRFAPSDLPAVIILTPETEAEEKLQRMVTQPWFMEAMEDVAREALEQSRRRPLYLSLNAANGLIQKLAKLDRRDEMVREVMVGIYNSAVLYSHNLLTQHNAEIIHSQFVLLFDRLITHREEMMSVQQSLEETRRQMIELRQRQAEVTAKQPDHILIFMITPFGDSYRPIEQAVRNVFERPPYCFEVRLARDYTHKPGLLDNVREHMIRAHGFIAEISELNPNVMFELGAAMLPDDGRPVFSLRSKDAHTAVPADLKEKLYVPYGSLTDPVEKLEADIRSAFERDGRPTHDGILALVAQRKKRFLSHTLLAGLRHTRLGPKNIEGLMKHYATVEDLLAAALPQVARAAGLQEYVITAIQGELKEQ
jgi:molecular chaperone HtpG